MFGVSLSSFLLNATIHFHLEKFLETHESIVCQLLRSTYVDDIIAGGKTEKEIFHLYTQSKEIFRKGGFNLRKFLTNLEHLQERINAQEEPTVHHSQMSQHTQKLLWNLQPSRAEEHKILGIP